MNKNQRFSASSDGQDNQVARELESLKTEMGSVEAEMDSLKKELEAQRTAICGSLPTSTTSENEPPRRQAARRQLKRNRLSENCSPSSIIWSVRWL